MAAEKRRVAVAIFNAAADIEAALKELSEKGIDTSDVYLFGAEATVSHMISQETGERFSALASNLVRILDSDGYDPLVASPQGDVCDILNTSSSEGSLEQRFSERLPNRLARSLEQSLRSGAVTLWIPVNEQDRQQSVPSILLRHASEPVQVHEIST